MNMTLTLSNDTMYCITVQGSLPLLKPFPVMAYYSAKFYTIIMHWFSHIGYIPQSTVYITLCLWTASTKSDLEVSSEGGICSPFAFYSIVVSHTWAGRGNGFGLLSQRKFGWVRWIQCGWRVDIATNIKTCQWQQEGRIFFFFFLMLAREIVQNSN